MTDSAIETVDLTEVPIGQRPLLENLLQLYLYDFSEFAEIGTPFGEVGGDGRFPYVYLDQYWRSDGCVPFVIHADRRPAGFALLNRWSVLGQPLDRAVAEFFVLRKYRRHGVGSRAAVQIFARFPGIWEVPVASYNAPALAFWRKTICAVLGSPAAESAGDGTRWAGTVFRFRIG